MDYAAVGPEHSLLHDYDRVQYDRVSDEDALEAFKLLNKIEGILPALESSHAVAWVLKNATKMNKNQTIIVNLSGRGDKDVDQVLNWNK